MATPALVVLLIVTLFMCSIASAQDDSIAVVTTGEVLVLDCLVEGPSGDVDHEVVWFLDDVEVSKASKLVLTNLNHTHHGSNITCYNETDVIHTQIIHFHHKLVQEVGKALILNCTTYPTAATNVTWHQSNKTATTDWVITDLDNVTSQLMIPNVTLDDTGLYSCMSSGGVSIRAFNISIGLFPQGPSSVDCSGCNYYNFTCEWQKIPDTYLPTDVTYEFKDSLKYSRGSWKECRNYLGNACYFSFGDPSVFRLNITNALGRLSIDVPEYNLNNDFTFLPPHIIGLEALSSSQLDIRWNISACDLYKNALKYTYKLSYTDGHTGQSHEVIKKKMTQDVMVMDNANTKYCFRLSGRHRGDYGQWSDEVCTRTLPTVPNVNFDGTEFKATQNAEEEDLRDIELTLKLVEIDSRDPFQGVSEIMLEVRLNTTTINETNRNTRSPSEPTNFTIDLEGRNDYSLEEDTFFYTIPGLSKYEDYIITLSAVNSAGSSNTILKVGAQLRKEGGFLVAALCVPLVILLIVALLAFGFQRLKNNSQPLPEPVYHKMSGNVKPTHIEPEVFDELPAVAKEKQRQMLVDLSREPEDKGYRTSSSSTTSSGVGTDTSSLEMGVVEKVPLLQTQNISGSIDKSPYSLLSELAPSLPHLQMAPDAMETDLDSMSPTGGHYSTDEGISVGGSSFYNHLGSYRDASQPNPYYSMCGRVPVRMNEPSNDSGYLADGSQRCSNAGYDDRLLRANDGDDESSLPSSPATPNCAYYCYLSTPTDAASEEKSQGYCDPYVIAANMPSSPPMRVMSENLATIEESPNHYMPQTTFGQNRSQLPCNSGYVDNTDICMGIRQTYIQDDMSSGSNSPSTQSSPEHAVIMHKNPRRNLDSSDEYMDNTSFSNPSSTPLHNCSLPSSADNDTPTPSRASSSSSAPQSNVYLDSPSTSNSFRTQPKGSAGYVTCEQFPQVQMPLPVADTPVQPLQNSAHIGTTLPTLSGNAGGYVPTAQMPMPTQRAYIPTDTAAQTQAPQTGSGSSDLGTKMPQSLPAADLSQEPGVLEQGPSVGVREQGSQSGYQPQEEIPTTKLESIREPPLLNESTNKRHEVCNGSVASHVGPDKHGTLPSTNGGYVSKEMTNFPSRTEPSQPLELNNNGYVRIP